MACAGNEHALHSEVNWVPTNLCVPVPEGVDPAAGRVRHRRGDRHARGEAMRGSAGRHGLRSRARARRPARRSAPRRSRRTGRRARPGRGPLQDGREAGALGCASPDARGLEHDARLLAEATGGLGADHVLSSPAALRTGRSRRPRDSPATGPASSTSARLDWTCPGTPTTTRSSTFDSPGRTGPAATTTATSSKASTTPPATCAGPNGGISPASSTCWRGASSTSSRSCPEPSGVESAVEVYDRLSSGDLHGVGFLFEYPAESETPDGNSNARTDGSETASQAGGSRPTATRIARPRSNTLGIGFIGAGNYASSMLLPHLVGELGSHFAMWPPTGPSVPWMQSAGSVSPKRAPMQRPCSKTTRSTPCSS